MGAGDTGLMALMALRMQEWPWLVGNTGWGMQNSLAKQRNRSLWHCGSSLPLTGVHRCRERLKEDLRPLEGLSPTKHQFLASNSSLNSRGPQRQGRVSPLTLYPEQVGVGPRRHLPPAGLVSLRMAVPLYSPQHPESPRLLPGFNPIWLSPWYLQYMHCTQKEEGTIQGSVLVSE